MINKIQLLDGNVYEVSAPDTAKTEGASFDSVFNKINSKDTTLEDIFVRAAKEYDIPVDLLKAVAQTESGFDVNAVSYCGASGIMQLMPETAAGLGVTDVFNPEQNIFGGAKLLSSMIDCYNGDVSMALAAYNAGWGAVEEYNGVPPYPETQAFISRIFDILSENNNPDLSDFKVNVVGIENGDSYSKVSNNSTIVSGDRFATYMPANGISNANVNNDMLNNISSLLLGSKADGTQMTLTEYISYTNYMKLVDEFQDIIGKLFFPNTNDNNDYMANAVSGNNSYKTGAQSSGTTANDALSLYQQSSNMNSTSRIRSLLGI